MSLDGLLTAQLLVSINVILIVVHVILGTVTLLIYLERKISAYIQDRIGPNRTGLDFGLVPLRFLRGLWGLGQSLADGLKFLLKEDYTPSQVDKALFTLAPMAIIIPALIGFVIIPWGGVWNIPDLSILGFHVEGGRAVVAGVDVNVGIIYLVAVASLGVYGVTLGGWASNNKYSFLGGLRCTAQMLAYEIPLGVSLLCVLLVVGTISPQGIVDYQLDHNWLVFAQPLAALIFFVAILAESNRLPFDNAEAEAELVGGYHTEYSSMRFALFFLAEYAHMIVGTAFFTLLFLGGWDIAPIVNLLPREAEGLFTLGGLGLVLLKFGVYFGKVVTIVCFIIVIRWTIPRLRYDQVMTMGWQGVIPLSLLVLVLTSVMVYLDLTQWWWMLAANLLLAGALFLVLAGTRRAMPNRRIRLYGSRFSPMPGELVRASPTHAMAVEDRPVAGTAPVTG